MINKYLAVLSTVLMGCILTLNAQSIPSPKSHFGFDIGDDYQLANYTQTEAYFKKLAAADALRTRYVDMGLTEEGRHQFMLIISSARNIKQLEQYKSIAQKLARAEQRDDATARQLAKQGKAVVWIDGGLHASETVGAHQLIQTAYTLLARQDDETRHILDNTIILMAHANPDGQELVANWYMKEADPPKRNMNVPRLWQKYIGHDNNRDFLMMNMKETQNITRQLYLEWFPQIVYNHHQSGPAGSVVAGPPFRDPFNYVYDPLLVTSLDGVGAAMNSRLNREGKPGYTQRSGTEFSTWWNGGLRTATYFHNMVGLLTEIVGSPAPSAIPLVPERLIPNAATPFPVTPQPWHFKQSIDYSVSLNYAVLNYAANNREDLLYNIYQMGKNSIARGSRDNWKLSPAKVEMIKAAYKKSLTSTGASPTGTTSGPVTIGGSSFGRAGMPVKYYDSVMRDPALRDARGYIIPADQPDFATAVRFINTGIRSGILVHKATAAFTVAGKQYPAGSYVIKTNQAFRPWVLDMFEPQDHPNDFLYPGGPPVRPYDMTGWTLAYQMGIEFDRILDDFTGPFERVPYGRLQTPPEYAFKPSKRGYLFSPAENNAFILLNELLKAGVPVYRLPASKNAHISFEGFFYVQTSTLANAVLQRNKNIGVKILADNDKSVNKLTKVKPARIAVWDNYGGSMTSGWTRWLFEQYHFPFTVVYPQELDAGDLRSKYDVIVFVGGAIPAVARGTSTGGFNRPVADVPAEFGKMTGRITSDKTIPQLKAFLEAGGSIVTVGSSANLAYHLNLPVRNALVEPGSNRPLGSDKFYIPGAVLRASVNFTSETYGLAQEIDVLYDNSPVFKLNEDAEKHGVKPLLWFATDKPLRSGWAWGQAYLKDGVTAFSAEVGKGNLYVFGPEITFRGMAHGTFKLLFNQLYLREN